MKIIFVYFSYEICSTDDCTKVRLSGRRQDPEDTFYSVPWEPHPWKEIIVLCVNIISGITITPTVSMWESVSERNN